MYPLCRRHGFLGKSYAIPPCSFCRVDMPEAKCNHFVAVTLFLGEVLRDPAV